MVDCDVRGLFSGFVVQDAGLCAITVLLAQPDQDSNTCLPGFRPILDIRSRGEALNERTKSNTIGWNMLVDGEWNTDIEPYTQMKAHSIGRKHRAAIGFEPGGYEIPLDCVGRGWHIDWVEKA